MKLICLLYSFLFRISTIDTGGVLRAAAQEALRSLFEEEDLFDGINKKVPPRRSTRAIRDEMITLSSLIIFSIVHWMERIPFPTQLSPSILHYLFTPSDTPSSSSQSIFNITIDDVKDINPYIGDILDSIYSINDFDPFPELDDMGIESEQLESVSILLHYLIIKNIQCQFQN